jgi:hypothetical protein
VAQNLFPSHHNQFAPFMAVIPQTFTGWETKEQELEPRNGGFEPLLRLKIK